jgi:hypothetical protein
MTAISAISAAYVGAVQADSAPPLPLGIPEARIAAVQDSLEISAEARLAAAQARNVPPFYDDPDPAWRVAHTEWMDQAEELFTPAKQPPAREAS